MTALSRRLRLLMLEDSPIDAELTMARLSSAGIEFDADRVEEREAFQAALERGGYDAILADFSLPNFDGLSALAMAREVRPGVPFIFVSGKLGEEIAVDSLKRGASDYVLKQRLERLAPALERAIGDAAIRAQQRRADAALRATEERARLALAAGRMATWERDLASDRLIWSPEARHVFHFAADRMPAECSIAIYQITCEGAEGAPKFEDIEQLKVEQNVMLGLSVGATIITAGLITTAITLLGTSEDGSTATAVAVPWTSPDGGGLMVLGQF